jgi:hypothetical protein
MMKIKSVKFLFCFFLPFSLSGTSEGSPGQCAAGKQILWYYAEPTVDEKTFSGFSNQVFTELSSPLAALGYCLTRYDKNDTVPFSFLYRENLLMRVVGKSSREDAPQDGKSQTTLIVHLMNIKDFKKGNFELFPDRPLVSLSFAPEDIGSILIIFMKKIIENLRTQYICNLMISSDPSGVRVAARSGLSDVTPFEWVVPVGKLDIQCKLKDYLMYKKEITMDRPGVYNYFIQMKKRQLYHSKFFIPGVGCGAASAVCYGFDYYFYNKYQSYKQPEADKDPGIFKRTFTTAQTFERLSASFFALSCSFFGLSIWF